MLPGVTRRGVFSPSSSRLPLTPPSSSSFLFMQCRTLFHISKEPRIATFYQPTYYQPLPVGHSFPMEKYPEMHSMLKEEHLAEEMLPTREVSVKELHLAHDSHYISKLFQGTLSTEEKRTLGFPLTSAHLSRWRLSTQGTIEAAFVALQRGVASNICSGYHHAFRDRGEGYCAINDIGVAIKVLQGETEAGSEPGNEERRENRRSSRSEGWIKKALVLDLDVHQGNGTASLFSQDPSVFTFSMHCKDNFPFGASRVSRYVEEEGTGKREMGGERRGKKDEGEDEEEERRTFQVTFPSTFQSDIDIDLKEGMKDDEYLDILQQQLEILFKTPSTSSSSSFPSSSSSSCLKTSHDVDFVFFIAGVDVSEGDKLGKLRISDKGLKRREELVLQFLLKEKRLPVMICTAGGYHKEGSKKTARLHCEALRAAKKVLYPNNTL